MKKLFPVPVSDDAVKQMIPLYRADWKTHSTWEFLNGVLSRCASEQTTHKPALVVRGVLLWISICLEMDDKEPAFLLLAEGVDAIRRVVPPTSMVNHDNSRRQFGNVLRDAIRGLADLDREERYIVSIIIACFARATFEMCMYQAPTRASPAHTIRDACVMTNLWEEFIEEFGVRPIMAGWNIWGNA